MCDKVVCDKDVCEREVACERDVCERLSATKLWVTKLCVREMCVKKLCAKELCLTKLRAIKLHACHVKRRSMSPSATPATQNEGRCHQEPRLPRKTKVDVTKCHACHAKCHACHAKWRGAPGDQRRPSAPPEPAKCNKCHVRHAKRKTQVDVAKCQACHVKRRWMSLSDTPALYQTLPCLSVAMSVCKM